MKMCAWLMYALGTAALWMSKYDLAAAMFSGGCFILIGAQQPKEKE